MTLRKNEIIDLTIHDLDRSGNGRGYHQDFSVLVPNTAPGDQLQVKLIKITHSYAVGKRLKMTSKSSHHQAPICEIAHQCGGCQTQHIQQQIISQWKWALLDQECAKYSNLSNCRIHPIVASTQTTQYRNKLQVSIRQPSALQSPIMGLSASHSNRIIPMQSCPIQHTDVNQALSITQRWIDKTSLSIFDPLTHRGTLRSLVCRMGYHTQELMVILVCTHAPGSLDDWISDLQDIPSIKSIQLNIHPEPNDEMMGPRFTTLWGQSTIHEKIDDQTFMMGPQSFFQTNSDQVPHLYHIVRHLLQSKKPTTIWDLYCGVGSIGQCLQRPDTQVIGIDTNEEAIHLAKQNATLNQLTHCHYYHSRIDEVLSQHPIKSDDVVICDPPRKGCDADTLATILSFRPSTIIMISCNPVTGCRDINKIIDVGYTVSDIYPVDMFPHTSHCELVCQLTFTTDSLS